MTAGITIGAILLALGLIERQRAKLLLFDRWRSVQPAEWSRAMKPAQRMFPFATVIRWLIVDERLVAWRFSPPEWVRHDDAAMRLYRRLRAAPFLAAMGVVIIGITIAAAA